MITRKSVELEGPDWDEMERRFNLSDEEQAREDVEFEAECDAYERRYKALMARLSVKQRYEYERRNALEALLRTRTRIDKMKTYDQWFQEVVLPMQMAYFKRRQMQLLDWRRYRKTGILPTLVKQ